jgi:hypothetical protein
MCLPRQGADPSNCRCFQMSACQTVDVFKWRQVKLILSPLSLANLTYLRRLATTNNSFGMSGGACCVYKGNNPDCSLIVTTIPLGAVFIPDRLVDKMGYAKGVTKYITHQTGNGHLT